MLMDATSAPASFVYADATYDGTAYYQRLTTE
jgi:hypothetical protein